MTPYSTGYQLQLLHCKGNISIRVMDPKVILFAVLLSCAQYTLGGYVPATAPAFYPSFYPSVVQQQAPVSIVQYPPPKQPLQLRPPTVAVPNTRPSVVAIHAQPQVQFPVTTTAQLPVVAIHAQQPLPVATQQVATVPNYSYSYAVKDATTGDEKSHQESRTGDNVIGRYTVVEPDGTLRTVTYTAGVHGFNAVVERTPGYAPPNAPVRVVTVAKPVAIPVSVARPVAIATPVAVNKPVAIAGPAFVNPIHASSFYPPGFGFQFGG